MIDEKKLIERLLSESINTGNSYGRGIASGIDTAIALINKQPKIGEWILCSEKLPENEQEVEITYTREHYLTGEKLYLTARAFYEDGTYTTEDSAYSWETGIMTKKQTHI